MLENKLKVTIDGLKIDTEQGTSILQAALRNGIYIPNLCYSPRLKPFGACRLCLVQVNNENLVTACETLVEDGMNIITENDEISNVRKIIAELLIVNHDEDCLTCSKGDICKLQEITAYLGIQENNLENLRRSVIEIPKDISNPFFERDLKKCILCGICVRVCSEILGVNAIDYGFRGYETRISAFGDKPILESNCVSCGECVIECPVGALLPKMTFKASREVKTICPYCGVGCNIILGIRGNKIVNVKGDPENSVNKGNLCVKGRFGYGFINHPNRLTNPLIKRNEEFEEVKWDEAFDFIAQNLLNYIKNGFAAISSARCTNEDNYVLQKFTRVLMGTNNIDNCARSCHAPSVAGLAQSMGSGAMSNSIDEIANANCIFSIGTNITETYPVIGMRVIEAVQNGTKLIVADPRKIPIAKHAHIFLNHESGTDVALLMGMMRVILDEELMDLDFINKRCENFENFKESLNEFHVEHVEEITGVPKKKIIEAAKLYASHKPASILYSLGITEHSHGTDNVFALSNLGLLTGNVGKPSTGVNPLRGQNNVQGSCDMGCLPDVYPGYQKVDVPRISEKFEKFWDCKLDKSPGLTIPDMIGVSNKEKVKALYIMGENPVLTEPDSSNIIRSLKKLDFLIVQDIFLTETAKLADVILPACSFAEKDGTFTNAERRVQIIRKAIEPIGKSNPDWWIICQIAKRLDGKGFDFNNPSEIAKEIASVTPIYGGIYHERLEKIGIQWPCQDQNDNGTPILHKNQFSTENGKGKFIPLHFIPPAEVSDNEYPFILTTGRSLYHYHTSTMTGMVKGLKKLYNHDFVKMNPIDASNLGIQDGDLVLVTSRRGKVKAMLKVTEESPKGVIFMTFHFSETSTNLLTNPAMDPISKTPEFKICAVRVEKYGKI
jgi:formate dehydrogenase (NADP+) alpha subunit